MPSKPYSSLFYQGQRAGSLNSARIVVPLITSIFKPKSVIDVGCGTGTWLAEFQKNGVDEILGVDGDYVDRKSLLVEERYFKPSDLTKPLDVSRTFDIACSFEVGEHLPTPSSKQFVKTLAQLAPVVLFSAAVPGQAGTDHINEQWQFFWFKLFREHKFVAVDCIRPALYNNNGVSWWYRQNIIAYCLPDHVPNGYAIIENEYDINRIDPEMMTGPRNGTQALAAIKAGVPILSAGIGRKIRSMVGSN